MSLHLIKSVKGKNFYEAPEGVVPLDLYGQEIQVGNVVAYGALLDRSATLHVGLVVDIEYTDNIGTLLHEEASFVLAVEIPSMKLQAVGERPNVEYRNRVMGKKVTRLYFPRRTLVVPGNAMTFWRRFSIGTLIDRGVQW